MSGNAIPLRPHHGMCLAFFQGQGYSEGFTAHMAALKARLEAGAAVRLTCAADEVCSACPNNQAGLCHKPALVAGYDRAVLERCGLEEGAELSYGSFAALVEARILRPGLRRTICGGCQWDHLCGK